MRTRKRRSPKGAALLEALIALAVLVTAGTAIAALAVESGHAVEQARAADSDLRRADAFFNVVTLWPREDLNRHLGTREEGSWRLRIDRPTSTLYTLTLTDSLGKRILLRTAVYRPEAPRDTL
jgi:type II secretory pathway pseudopilin PulG